MFVILQIESKVDSLLCSKFVVILVVFLFIVVHLFVDLLLSTSMITILMWLVFIDVTAHWMLLKFVVMATKVMWYESTIICYSFDIGSIWFSCSSSNCICSPISIIVNPYSWELTFCGIDFNGYKLSSNTYFIPPASLWELSFPPLRFAIPSFAILVSNGPTPSIYPLSYSSCKVFDYGVKTKGSY